MKAAGKCITSREIHPMKKANVTLQLNERRKRERREWNIPSNQTLGLTTDELLSKKLEYLFKLHFL